MVKAIIFDAYGTLLDTKNGSVNATKKILLKNQSNLDPVEFYSMWKKIHRENIDNLTKFKTEEEIFYMDLQFLFSYYNIKGNAEVDVKIMLDTLGIREVYDDVLETLHILRKRYKVYIGSTSDSKALKEDIKRNNIKVDDIFTSEDLKVYKPKKEFFTKILEKINLEPNETMYVGDSQIDDLLGASKAYIPTIWINRKANAILDNIPKPKYEIQSLVEILKII